ncbi:MAG: DnaJ domain-containing protein, partial [Bacteroidetes bacterium]|nr:DnaJ domain-containing protein [Bacteroidota bacterium]
DYVKEFFKQQFGIKKTEERLLVLRDLLKQDFAIKDVCIQIKSRIDHASRLQMLHFLFGLAAADGELAAAEIEMIKNIAYWLGISANDFESIKAMFTKHSNTSVEWAYTILEVSESASDDELKKAYRKMAVKFHPDKVSHLGEEYQKDATEKFKKVQEAWESIKKKRNIV